MKSIMKSMGRLCFRNFLIHLLLLLTILWVGEAGAAQLTLTWTDNSTNEDGFKVERKTETTGTYSQIAVLGPDTTTYVDSGLADGITHCYRGRAFNASGDSPYTNEVCNIVAGAPSLITAAPTSIVADGTSTSTITVQLYDDNSNKLTTGGDTVALSTTLGTLGTVTDNGNGTYVTTLTSATTAGTANITGTVNGSAITDNATVIFTPYLGVDLNLTVAESSDPIQAGKEISYTLTFSNSSSANETALGVTLTDTLPANTTFISASDGGTIDDTETLVTWALGDLEPGDSGTRTLVLEVNSHLPDGTLLTNNATLQETQGDSASSSQTTTIQSAAVLSLSQSDNPDPVKAGEQITYTLSFGNSSSANEAALEAMLTDTLPANTTFVSASDGGTIDDTGTMVTWALGDLEPGDSGPRTVVVEVNSPLPDGTLLTNNATLQETQGDSASASQTTTVQSAAVLSLSQSDSPDPVKAGEQITYTLSFGNSSSANEAALEAMLTDTLPANTTFVSASDGGTIEDTGTMVTWALGDLEPGDSGTRTLVLEVNSHLPDGTLLTNGITLEDTQGYSATSSEATTVQSALSVEIDIKPGEGFILSRDPNFSTDDREYAQSDTIYMELFTEFIDPAAVRKARWEVKVAGVRLKGNLTNNGDGSYTASQSLGQFSPGDTGTVKLKVEGPTKNDKVEFRNIPISIVP